MPSAETPEMRRGGPTQRAMCLPRGVKFLWKQVLEPIAAGGGNGKRLALDLGSPLHCEASREDQGDVPPVDPRECIAHECLPHV